MNDLEAIWRQVTELLMDEIVSQQNRDYLNVTQLRAIVEDTVMLSVPDPATREIVENRLRPAIAEALASVLGRRVQVVATVRPPDQRQVTAPLPATTDLTLVLPGPIAERLSTDAGEAGRTVARHIMHILIGDILREDAKRHRAWAAAHPADAARETYETAVDAIDREVMRLVDDGLDEQEGAAIRDRLVAELDATRAPGYLDPADRSIPWNADRHIAIMNAVLRNDVEQQLAELEQRAAESARFGRPHEQRRYLAQAVALKERYLGVDSR